VILRSPTTTLATLPTSAPLADKLSGGSDGQGHNNDDDGSAMDSVILYLSSSDRAVQAAALQTLAELLDDALDSGSDTLSGIGNDVAVRKVSPFRATDHPLSSQLSSLGISLDHFGLEESSARDTALTTASPSRRQRSYPHTLTPSHLSFHIIRHHHQVNPVNTRSYRGDQST
jgi:hypothetical protein